MPNFDSKINAAKGTALALCGLIASAISLAVGQIPAVENGAVEIPTLDEILSVAVTSLVLYGYGRFNNWRKHGRNVPLWMQDLDLVPLVRLLFPALLVVALVGCVVTTESPDGTVVTRYELTITPAEAEQWIPAVRQTVEALRGSPDSNEDDLERWERFLDRLERIAASGKPAAVSPPPEPAP